MCAFIYVRERRLVRDSNLECRLRHVVLSEKPTIHRVEAVDRSQRYRGKFNAFWDIQFSEVNNDIFNIYFYWFHQIYSTYKMSYNRDKKV